MRRAVAVAAGLASLVACRAAYAEADAAPAARSADPDAGVHARFVAAGSYARLLHLGFVGYSGTLGVGGRVARGLDLFVSASYGRARTANGLGLYEAGGDVGLAHAVGPLSFGASLGFVSLEIPRVSEPASSIKRAGLGLQGWVGVDLWRPRDDRGQVLFLALRPETDWVGPQVLVRVTAGVGFRL